MGSLKELKNGNGSEDWKKTSVFQYHLGSDIKNARSFNSNESHAAVDKKTHILRKPTIYHSQSQIGRILQKFYQRLPFVPQPLRSTSVGILVSGPADGMGMDG